MGMIVPHGLVFEMRDFIHRCFWPFGTKFFPQYPDYPRRWGKATPKGGYPLSKCENVF
jgi:hypothetical protein